MTGLNTQMEKVGCEQNSGETERGEERERERERESIAKMSNGIGNKIGHRRKYL
jgi:hypothetical protein